MKKVEQFFLTEISTIPFILKNLAVSDLILYLNDTDTFVYKNSLKLYKDEANPFWNSTLALCTRTEDKHDPRGPKSFPSRTIVYYQEGAMGKDRALINIRPSPSGDWRGRQGKSGLPSPPTKPFVNELYTLRL